VHSRDASSLLAAIVDCKNKQNDSNNTAFMIFFISENSRIDEKELRCGKTFRMHSTKWNISHKVGNTNLQMISLWTGREGVCSREKKTGKEARGKRRA
jgi:hypothetical protein